MKVLHVAEKPSVARELSKILCPGGNPRCVCALLLPYKFEFHLGIHYHVFLLLFLMFVQQNRQGNGNPAYIFHSSALRNQEDEFVVTSVRGHIKEIDFDQAYR